MTLDLALALMTFAFVTSITPGPNNLMLMASGANFGFRRTLPHMLGVALGFVMMTVPVGIGLMRVFDLVPGSYAALRLLCLGFLLYLAWKILRASAPSDAAAGAAPLTFLQAAAFQWVNPKALAMALTAISIYAPGRRTGSVVAVALIFGMVNLPSVSYWALIGTQLRRFLTSPLRLRLFNYVAAALLVASLLPVLAQGAPGDGSP